jgi:ParB/RepB/Spo0J family partition protein
MAKPATVEVLASEADFRVIPIAKLVESPSNRRRKSWGNLDELAESIKAKGVLVPICVRPAPTGLVEGAFEIVYGHRRFRAATKAGLPAMPAIVRELTDVEVIEAQVIENLQRTDVHPLEEAEGYEQLLAAKDRIRTVDDIAAKVGKSKAYVYARLKLLDLTAESREAYYGGKLSASTALCLARVTPELQKQALEALVPTWRRIEEDGPLPAREASNILQRGFMRALKDAPFPITDPDLVPAAGTCSACPKRSGAQPQLFEDVGNADVCTDPGCFDSKRDAEWKKRAAAAEAAGKKVLAAKEARDLFDGYSLLPRGNSGYVSLDGDCPEDPKRRSYAKLLGKRAAGVIVLAQDPKGATRELVPKKEIGKLLKAAGHDFKAARAATSSVNKADHAKRKAEREVEQEVSRRRHAKVLAAIGAKEPGDEFWRLAAVAMEDTAQEIVRDERGLDDDHEDVSVTAHVATMKGKELRLFVLGLVVDPLLTPYPYGEVVKAQKALYAWAGVDEKAIRAEAKEALKAKASAPPKKNPAEQLEDLFFERDRNDVRLQVARVTAGAYRLRFDAPGALWAATWLPLSGKGQVLLAGGTEKECKEACRKHLTESTADAMLKNAGAGELTKKDTKGAAVKRNGSRR